VFVCECDFDPHSELHSSQPVRCFPGPCLRGAAHGGVAAMDRFGAPAATERSSPEGMDPIERLLAHFAPGVKALTAVAGPWEILAHPAESGGDFGGVGQRSWRFEPAFFTRVRLERVVALSAFLIGLVWARWTALPHGLGEMFKLSPPLFLRRVRFAQRTTSLGVLQLTEFGRWARQGILPHARTLEIWAAGRLDPRVLLQMFARFDRAAEQEDLARFMVTGETSRREIYAVEEPVG
jgi:hypothetical protein